jgi:SAM-dependent methyltransferase
MNLTPPHNSAFDRAAEKYDSWFDRNRFTYESEITAIRDLLPDFDDGLEVGVGTGRFAAPLCVRTGLDPSIAMGRIARRRGIDVHIGVAERMPFADGSFDLALMVTTICFLSDLDAALRECHRVLRPGGHLLIGMLDFFAPIGAWYAEQVAGSEFFRGATMRPVDDVLSHLAFAGFVSPDLRQTIFRHPSSMAAPDTVRGGHGKGLFVAIRTVKPVERKARGPGSRRR